MFEQSPIDMRLVCVNSSATLLYIDNFLLLNRRMGAR